jgi:hypothetical protein
MNLCTIGTSGSFQFSPDGSGFARSRAISHDCEIGQPSGCPQGRGAWMPRVKSRDCAEAYIMYVAQAIPQIDAEIAEKGHFWMETR